MARHKPLRSPRLARKRRQKTAKKLLLLTVLALLVLGGAAYAFSRPEFRIERIEVSGAARVQEEHIRETVKNKLSGAYLGIIPKAHTLLYPKETIKSALLEQFPAVRDASVSLRSLAVVRIAVREREIAALWCADGCVYIDDGGVAFAAAPEESPSIYYRFEQTNTSTPLGKAVIEKERLASLIVLLRELENRGLVPVRTALLKERELEVEVKGGTKLLFREGGVERALHGLQSLLKEGVLPKSGDKLRVTYIDLRYGNKIYYKPR